MNHCSISIRNESKSSSSSSSSSSHIITTTHRMPPDNSKTAYPTHLKIASLISILHISIGLTFWVWSITLWARGQYDSGIVLFLLPIATGLLGLRIVYYLLLCYWQQQTNNNSNQNRSEHNDNNRDDQEVVETSSDDQQPTTMSSDNNKCCYSYRNNCWFILLLLTHTFTTAVYAYAAVQDLGKSRGYQLYCQISAICWGVSGVIIFVLACHFRDKFQVGGVQGGS